MNVLNLVDQDEISFAPGDSETKEGDKEFLFITRPRAKINTQLSYNYKKVYAYGVDTFHGKLVLRNPYKSFDFLNELKVLVKKIDFYYSDVEIIKSDQYAHKAISGRFFQFYENEQTIAAGALNCYEIAKKIIEVNEIDHVITREVRDANKIGVMLACWELGIPFHTLEPTGVSGGFFLKSYLHENNELIERFSSLTGNGKLFTIRNFHDGEDFLFDTFSKSSSLFETTRIWHQKKMNRFWSETTSILCKNFLKIISKPVASILCYARLKRSGVIPFHKKNLFAVLIADIGIPFFVIRGKLRAIIGRILSRLTSTQGNLAPPFLIPLHYFPESTTISGKSWRNVKSEVDLFSDEDFQKWIGSSHILLCEHPAYLNFGDRSNVFFKRILRTIPTVQIDKWSGGVDLGSRPQAVISIAGSVLFEAAKERIPAYMVKFSPLLFVDGIKQVADLFSPTIDRDLHFNRKRGITPEHYERVCAENALRREQISYDVIIHCIKFGCD